MFFNSGLRGARAKDGQGSVGNRELFVQKKDPVPSITSWSIQGTDDTALDPAGGQTVIVNGTGFASGLTGIVGSTTLASVTVVSSTRVTFTSTAKSAGTYTLILSNSSGAAAIYVPGITYSSIPTYTTAAGSIGSSYETTAISTQVVATSDSALTYSLATGALPSGATLYANGVITGTAPVDSSSTTYNFSITATDAELQDVTRSFTLTINTDVVTWSSPASGTTYTLPGNAPISNVTLSATSAAGYGVTYTANALPTGVTLSSGVISGTPTVEANTTTLLTATASTTNRSATNTIYWVVTLNDQYFKYTSMLMSSTVVTNTFVTDISSNNFDITVVGDAKPSKFNPYTPGYYSAYFDGTGDYLSLASNTAFNMGTNNFTVEGWYYFTALPGSGTNDNLYTFGNYNPYLYLWGDGTIVLRSSQVSGDIINVSHGFSVGQWYHLALVKTSTSFVLYKNGAVLGSGTSSAIVSENKALEIGGQSTFGFTGYLSNFRIVKDTSVYTAAFTPPTTPLTAIANTSLLTCQSNRLIDNSTNAFTITKAGDTAINSLQPFTPNSSYATYGSQYSSATSAYSTVSMGGTQAFGTGDFTVECWLNPIAATAVNLCLPTTSTSTWGFLTFNSQLYWQEGGGNLGGTGYGSIPLNAWTHLAVSRTSSVLKMFINGVQVYSAANTYNHSNSTTVRGIGPKDGGSAPCYISDFRVVTGTGIYTAAFTPPTTPLTAVTNTSLLTCQTVVPATSTTMVDESSLNNSITRNGNTNIGTFSPLNGSYSNYFDGTGDYLSLPTNTALDFSTGNFTVEAWVYPNSLASSWMIVSASGAGGFFFGYNSTDIIGYGFGRSTIAWDYRVAGSATVGVWQHVAVTRSGTSMRMFVNGTQIGTTQTISTAYNLGTTSTTIGSEGAGSYLNGYISNLRVVKGTAVYTANFTPSTTPLNSIANTSLLTCNSNRFIDYSPINSVITKNGDAAVNKFSPFPGYITNFASYSGYFDGTGDYLTFTNTTGQGVNFGTGDFTVELWYYMTNNTTNSTYHTFIRQDTTPGAFDFGYRPSATQLVLARNATGEVTVSVTLVLNTWNHIAVSRSGTNLRFFVNGTQVGSTATNSYDFSVTGGTVRIGSSNFDSTHTVYGYISNLRGVRSALYTTTFTPPTAPLTAISGTSLLTCQSTTFIDNSTNAFTFTVNGDAKPVIQNPFTNTFTSPVAYSPSTLGTSMYFDGTGDYLTVPSNAALTIGTSSATVEFWIYPTAVDGYRRVISSTNSTFTSGTFCLRYNNSSTFALVASTNTIVASSIPPANTWSHVAWVGVGGTSQTLYINGVNVGTAGSYNYTEAIQYIGGYYSVGPAEFMVGYMSNARVVKGTALYTGPFVPSGQPLPAVQNTTLLLSSTITPSIYDAAELSDMETVGNSKLTTSNSPYYGSYSGYFDGSGDYLSVPSNAAFALPGDFTVESWLYVTSFAAERTIIDLRGATSTVGFLGAIAITTGYPFIYKESTGTILTSSTAVTLNAWTHVAFVRSGTTLVIYVNGVNCGSTTDSTSWSAPNTTGRIGANKDAGAVMLGYISNLRVVKGTAVYTANFTPSTSPLTAISGTSLLTCQSNRFIDKSTNAFTITRNGDTLVSAFQPFGSSNLTKYSSVYFDGTGDYLNMIQNPVFALRSDYTIEAWVYRTDSGVQRAIVDLRGGANLNVLFYMNTSNQLIAFNSTSSWITSTGTVPLNQWAHVAISRSGTSVKLFINGVNDGTATNSDLNVSVGPAYIGRQNGSTSSDWIGYISDIRITNGYARYTTTFTPPTVPLIGF